MMIRGLLLAVCSLLIWAAGCATTGPCALDYIILPEQKTVAIRDPAMLPPAPIPPLPPPRTVAEKDPPQTGEWRLSLDEAIHLALINAKVVRVLTGLTAVSSGKTIYDAAITNTTIDQAQAAFDPTATHRTRYNHIETPGALLDPFHPGRSLLFGTLGNDFHAESGVTKTNVVGGQWAVNWVEDPNWSFSDLLGSRVPLYPQNRSFLEASYTQPLLQGGGFKVNMAPIVIARLDTERSFFDYKDSVQELVRSTIEGYWNLVQARTDEWARQIQVDQSEEAYKREKARLESGFADLRDVAQARVTYNQFRASLIAAKATVIAREGALRNLLGLPPSGCPPIVPNSAPSSTRLRPDWDALLCLAEQRRPDIVELKLILEADQVRLVQAENQNMPRLDAIALYRWNGLSGVMPSGDYLASRPGQFTDWTVGINFSVPLGLRDARARVRQQSLVIARDRANIEQGLHAAVHQLALTVRDLDSNYEQYLAYKETRAAALINLRVQIEQFRANRNIYLNVLQALNDWGNSVSQEALSLISYNVSLATLERQTGTILDTHGLVFHEERFRAAGPLGVFGHGQCYPAALPGAGMPDRYPGTAEPGENAFDLTKPNLRPGERKDESELPAPRQMPGELPAPRQVPPDR
jgi:outer membrane protein TolC